MCYKLFVLTDGYKIAQKKANKAKNTNNLSSNNEELQKSKYKKKKKKIPHNKLDSENYLSSEISDTDSTVYPNTPTDNAQLKDSKF